MADFIIVLAQTWSVHININLDFWSNTNNYDRLLNITPQIQCILLLSYIVAA